MRPFNLEEYLENPNLKTVRRDGTPVRIICTDKKGLFPIVGLVVDRYGESEDYVSFTKEGRCGFSSDDFDLMFETKTVTQYLVAITKPGNVLPSVCFHEVFDDEESATVACVKYIESHGSGYSYTIVTIETEV